MGITYDSENHYFILFITQATAFWSAVAVFLIIVILSFLHFLRVKVLKDMITDVKRQRDTWLQNWVAISSRLNGNPDYIGLNEYAHNVHMSQNTWWLDLNRPCIHVNRDGHMVKPEDCLECGGAGYHKLNRNFGETLMLIVTELAEAMEGQRKDLMDTHLPHRPMVEVEFADAMIRLLDWAGAKKWDIEGAFREKMAYNARRADHKIENRLAANGKKY